jgi:hypothetical protein
MPLSTRNGGELAHIASTDVRAARRSWLTATAIYLREYWRLGGVSDSSPLLSGVRDAGEVRSRHARIQLHTLDAGAGSIANARTEVEFSQAVCGDPVNVRRRASPCCHERFAQRENTVSAAS